LAPSAREVRRRDAVERQREKHSALPCSQFLLDQIGERVSRLASCAQLVGPAGMLRPHPPMLEPVVDRKLARALRERAQCGRHPPLGDAAGPGGEQAVAPELVELGEDRHYGIARTLNRQVVELRTGWM
jgi:hypothetical protein